MSDPRSDALSLELARRRDDDGFRLAAPVLRDLAAELAPSGHVLSFFDAAGWMLWMDGCPRNAARLAAIGFRPGERCQPRVGATDAAAAASGSSPAEEVVLAAGPRLEEEWVTSVAAIASPGSSVPAGFVHVAAPAAREKREIVAARAIAHVIQERLDSAMSVRQHIVDYALRVGGEVQDVVLAVDTGAHVIGSTDSARCRLAFDGVHVPAPVQERLAALVAGWGAAGDERRSGDRDLEIDWPGATCQVKLVASVIRYREQVLGAIVRGVVDPRRRRAPRAPQGAAAVARYEFEQILGDSEAIRAAVALARIAARNDLPVVLSGESGTGKELFAQAIHAASARRAGPLVAVNCACIPASLLEAELFGYEAGTFTGARADGNVGKFERADGGTLLLDEVSELSAQGQAALLRVLQEREVVRLGGSTPRRVDVRVVAASNKSLDAEIAAGHFRSDLYFRLHVLAVPVPALRERREDVKLLAAAFLRDAEIQLGRSGLALSAGAIAALEAHDWPGNVRELRNAILCTAATAATDVIEAADLPETVRAAPAARGAPPAAPAAPDGEPLADREELLRALASSSSWNVAQVASALHVSRTTLYRWLRKYHIER